jgi:hypothetical protein
MLVTVVAHPLPIDGAADNLPNLRIRQEQIMVDWR